MRVILCDLDGTVADLSHRLHFISGETKNWDGFFAACPADSLIQDVANTVRTLSDAGCSIIYVTGRSDAIRAQTAQWIADNFLPDGPIYMRKAGDHRHDNIVKSELLDHLLDSVRRDDILGAFEDRKQVVDMYRQRGLTVFQVADGNF